MSENLKVTDYTKTKFFASIDLTSKVISALALVALGVAGWIFQLQTEKSRKADERFEVQERRYLPMLRSLSNLEVKLEDISQELVQSKASIVKGNRLDDLNFELAFVADSIFEPDEKLQILISTPESFLSARYSNVEKVQVPLRSTVLMCSELLILRKVTFNVKEASEVYLDSKRKYLQARGVEIFSPSPDAYLAWQAWLGSHPLRLEGVPPSDFAKLLLEIRLEVVRTIQDILRNHVDLGDRYVQIRDEIEKNKRSAPNRNTIK